MWSRLHFARRRRNSREPLPHGCHKGPLHEESLPIDSICGCKTCLTYTRAYLYHLFQVKDPLGMRLVSYHNVWFMCNLGRMIRESIMSGSFKKLYDSWLK